MHVRESKYDQKTKDAAITLVKVGVTVKDVCKKMNVPDTALRYWLAKDAETMGAVMGAARAFAEGFQKPKVEIKPEVKPITITPSVPKKDFAALKQEVEEILQYLCRMEEKGVRA